MSPSAKPALEWSKQRGGFIVSIPRIARYGGDDCREFFEGAIRKTLEDPPAAAVPPVTLEDGGAASGEVIASKDAGDDWETVHVGAPAPAAAARASFPKPEYLPLVGALPRPDDLLLRPPYNLRVQASYETVTVECSHSPTLQLLHDYLAQWCRVNHNRTDKVRLSCCCRCVWRS